MERMRMLVALTINGERHAPGDVVELPGDLAASLEAAGAASRYVALAPAAVRRLDPRPQHMDPM